MSKNEAPVVACPKCGAKSFVAGPDGEIRINGCSCSLHIARQQLAQWQRYASYCRCCAESGEHCLLDFDAFQANERKMQA